jgi:small subunit ribosomal protein S16
MAVKIRLTRKGANKKPYYRVIVADSQAPRDGRFIELLGTYDPNKDPFELIIEKDRLSHWLSKGAKPTETVSSLLRSRNLF